jgi:hypothetical protein
LGATAFFTADLADSAVDVDELADELASVPDGGLAEFWQPKASKPEHIMTKSIETRPRFIDIPPRAESSFFI